MENIPTVLEKSVRTKKERKLLILIPIILSIIAISFFVIISNMKSNFISVPLSQTVGINVSQDFSFTLSPNGRWIVYFEEKYPYYDQFNLFAFDTLNNKKFAIDVGDVNTGALQLQIKNNCWSKDSRYCILPVGELVNSPSIIERKKAITVPDNSPWLIGKQLAESEFTETGGSVGYLNNGPDVLIDFSGTAPVFKKQYFDSNLIDIFSKNKN